MRLLKYILTSMLLLNTAFAMLVSYDSEFGQVGGVGSSLKQPVDMAVLFGSQIVVDKHNKRVQRYSLSGKYHGAYENVNLKNPIAVATYDESVYILDKSDKAIHVFDIKGTYQKSIYEYGRNKKKFKNPIDIVLDQEGTLFVIDVDKIVKIKKSGFTGSLSFDQFGLESPKRIEVGIKGDLFVLDSAGIKQIDPERMTSKEEISKNDIVDFTLGERGEVYALFLDGSISMYREGLEMFSMSQVHLGAKGVMFSGSKIYVLDTQKSKVVVYSIK